MSAKDHNADIPFLDMQKINDRTVDGTSKETC